ncbi:hypothetical protein N0V95_000594 [Ascochyta clinopodiicola]|nr:hypothetical protein N0V95_000594 [Ascochyta clinopodiicola]
MQDDTEEPLPTWDNFTTSTHFSHETKLRIAREVLEIKQHWNVNWQSELRAGGIHIQDQPSFHLANTLAQLAAFEPDITHLLATLPDFRAFQATQAPIAGKRVDPKTSSLFGTVEQRIEYTSYRFLEAWLEYLKPPALPSSVNTGRAARAAARAAAKRSEKTQLTKQPTTPRSARSSQETIQSTPSLYSKIPVFIQLTFDEELPISPVTIRDRRSQTAHNRSSGIADMLQDSLLRQLAKLLSETKHRGKALKKEVQDAEVALSQARSERDTVWLNIDDDPAIEVEATVDLLEEAIERFETKRAIEQKLLVFLTTHKDEYHHLASASVSAANNADTLDPTRAEDAIAAFTAKIDAYEEAKNRLQDAETAVNDAEQAHAESGEALTTFVKRLKEVRDTTRDWNNEFRFSTLDDELARVEDS